MQTMIEPDELNENELAWLLGLAHAKRRRRQRDIGAMRRHPGQPEWEFKQARERADRALAFAQSVEDHLILLLADADRSLLREEWMHRRLAELERDAA